MSSPLMRRPRITLDFAGTPRAASAKGVAMLVAGALYAGSAILDWQDARETATRWEERAQQQVRAAQHSGRGSDRVDDDQRRQLDATAKVVSRLALPWDELYLALERSTGNDTSLLAILPNADKGEVRLSGEARDFAALRAYMRRLGESGSLADVRLVNHDVRESDAQKPVVFSIVATWRTVP